MFKLWPSKTFQHFIDNTKPFDYPVNIDQQGWWGEGDMTQTHRLSMYQLMSCHSVCIRSTLAQITTV